jgi:hypothetical protein
MKIVDPSHTTLQIKGARAGLSRVAAILET